MVQCIAEIHWYDWVLNNILNKVLQMCWIGMFVVYNLYSLFVLLPPSCVPACTPMSCVPVCDADALDTDIHARGCVHAGVGRCVRVHPGVPLWGVASLLQRSIRLEKFLLKSKAPLE